MSTTVDPALLVARAEEAAWLIETLQARCAALRFAVASRDAAIQDLGARLSAATAAFTDNPHPAT